MSIRRQTDIRRRLGNKHEWSNSAIETMEQLLVHGVLGRLGDRSESHSSDEESKAVVMKVKISKQLNFNLDESIF